MFSPSQKAWGVECFLFFDVFYDFSDVTIADLRQLFFSIDPKLDDHQCDKYTKLAFRSSSAEEEILKLSTANVMENLRRSCIKRI